MRFHHMHYFFWLLFSLGSFSLLAQTTTGPDSLLVDPALAHRPMRDLDTLQLGIPRTESAASVVVVYQWDTLQVLDTLSIVTKDSLSWAALPLPFLSVQRPDERILGVHLLFALEQQPDSTLVLPIALYDNPDLKGHLSLNFSGGWKEDDPYWNTAALYKLLLQSSRVRDSLTLWEQTGTRLEFLLDHTEQRLTDHYTELASYEAIPHKSPILKQQITIIRRTHRETLRLLQKDSLEEADRLEIANLTTQHSKALTIYQDKASPDQQEALTQWLAQVPLKLPLQHQLQQIEVQLEDCYQKQAHFRQQALQIEAAILIFRHRI